MGNEAQPHTPVMLAEVLKCLKPQDNETYIDGTFGYGGYSQAILKSAACKLIAIDRDPSAVKNGLELQKNNDRFSMIEGCFGDMATLIDHKVNGIVLDIGVSSMQIDQAERGFSFAKDGPLDMRMGTQELTAATIVNEWGETDIADIIYQYGEERHSRRIARAIVEHRKTTALETTAQLADIVKAAMPPSREKIHPATRTFQGLRIAVNDELGELERALKAAEKLLHPEGRLIVVTFHSLEDRIVKNFFKEKSGMNDTQSRYMPASSPAGSSDPSLSTFRLSSPKHLKVSDQEAKINPRARSAKLRWAIRTEAAA